MLIVGIGAGLSLIPRAHAYWLWWGFGAKEMLKEQYPTYVVSGATSACGGEGVRRNFG